MSDEKSISGENERKNVESVRREGERGGGLVTLEMGRQRILHGPSLRVSDPHGRLRPAVGEQWNGLVFRLADVSIRRLKRVQIGLVGTVCTRITSSYTILDLSNPLKRSETCLGQLF